MKRIWMARVLLILRYYKWENNLISNSTLSRIYPSWQIRILIKFVVGNDFFIDLLTIWKLFDFYFQYLFCLKRFSTIIELILHKLLFQRTVDVETRIPPPSKTYILSPEIHDTRCLELFFSEIKKIFHDLMHLPSCKPYGKTWVSNIILAWINDH